MRDKKTISTRKTSFDVAQRLIMLAANVKETSHILHMFSNVINSESDLDLKRWQSVHILNKLVQQNICL